jgi:hypothetical protein
MNIHPVRHDEGAARLNRIREFPLADVTESLLKVPRRQIAALEREVDVTK